VQVRAQLAAADAATTTMAAAVASATAGQIEAQEELLAARELRRAVPGMPLSSICTQHTGTTDCDLRSVEKRPLRPIPSIHPKVGPREAVWTAAAFLDHRQRSPHRAHPLLCCHERDRKDYSCLLCAHFLVQPIALNNGKDARGPCGDGPFCDACIRGHLKTSPWCPACKQPTTADQIIEDTRIERALRGVLVKCAYCLEGCEWRGEIRHFSAHQQSCPVIGADLRARAPGELK
jgi:hypothetical protein